MFAGTKAPAAARPRVTVDKITKMFASDVENMLPRHWSASRNHPLQEFLEQGEIQELQDCSNRGVFGAPIKITPSMTVIGLMWVYAVKKHEVTGLFRKVRCRITLMGNQERNLITRLEAYAPVAQTITARVLIVSHLHLKGILYRKLDVKNAHINEYMKREVQCKMPPGYLVYVNKSGGVTFRKLRQGEKQPTDECLPLIMALYGGMECGRIFWEAWVDWHIADGFQIIHEERCYLQKRDGKGSWIKLCYHVDDNLIASLGEKYYASYLKRVGICLLYTSDAADE